MDRGLGGTSIASLQKSLIDAKPHKQKQDIVIRSEFNKGWVTKLIEHHPLVHIQFIVESLFFTACDSFIHTAYYQYFGVDNVYASLSLFNIWLVLESM